MLDKINIFRKQAGVPEMVLDKDLNTLSYIRAKGFVSGKFGNHNWDGSHDELVDYTVNYFLDLSDENYYYNSFSENAGLAGSASSIIWINTNDFDQYQKVIYSDYPSKYKYTANGNTWILMDTEKIY